MNYAPLQTPDVAISFHSLRLRFLPTRITRDEPFGVAVKEFSHFTNKIDSQDSTRSLPSHPQSHVFTMQILVNPGSALRMSGNKKSGPLGRSPTLVSLTIEYYSVITWSAHSTSDTKIAGLPNFAP
jgi:hypothetical protein